MWLNETLNIKYPLIQGGMARVATGAFAAASSNAGALGLIGSGGMTAEMLKDAIKEAKSLTDKPFGVNLMLMNPEADKQAQLVIDEGIKVVTTGAGNPGKYMKAWKEAGIIVIPVVPSVALAKRMERAGADAVIAEGTESGGHVGELTTMALLPQVKAAVNIPVIGAGGIASGKQALAALALGADGFQVGTMLLAAKEAPIHENYRQEVLKAKDTGTTVTGRIAGTPVRIIKNKMAKEYIKREKEGASMMELEKFTLGGLRRAVVEGDVDTGSLMAGQVAGMINKEDTLANIIENLFKELKEEQKKIAEVNL
ncbi:MULTISPECIES: nitronate monooxygenase [Kandleria]|jgi:enoyl-[acyl-carrier protein] reductase II|uniref:Probable nitronate monooxygenase n=1 Tax=Kandleria vitulina TaxID=1630 RepID=A0A1H2UUJ0_9FIRM|nr:MULTISPECIES: nitronate monooxygenase [Kandleria]MBP3275870.1 nitronate monooxygenase [Kandleria sp.]SDL86881.1 enoyl-[acyl-carrier protein] reductase II [Kandleria vitulina]SDW59239.1 enoyl-[acyl-carrier protein] reductase II [Kandleria vitulina]HAH76070.1 enoyl-[acyl-carrier-protein] reductase FabK [Kandleria vitulina]HBG68067.1 enoyl-[acyl-carrier-protein] reductase FabK [Kandleria vitulina]